MTITYFLNKRRGAFCFFPAAFHLNERSWSLQNGHLYLILSIQVLTDWSLMTHICASKLTIIGPDYGFSPCRRQAIIWTDAGILLIRILATNVSEIFSEINTFSFKNTFDNVVWEMAALLTRALRPDHSRQTGNQYDGCWCFVYLRHQHDDNYVWWVPPGLPQGTISVQRWRVIQIHIHVS